MEGLGGQARRFGLSTMPCRKLRGGWDEWSADLYTQQLADSRRLLAALVVAAQGFL